MRLARGSHLGPYEVLSTLGTGGMAEVYRAHDTRLGRDIALKVVNEALAADPELVRRFEQEARLAGSLNHPNLVAVYDFGVHEGAPYFITELLKGESLRQRLARGRVPVDTALDWGAQLAQGLAAAHTRGIVHRDVKPENVFITSEGHVKLLDFGIAKLALESRAQGPHGLLEETVTPTGGETRTGAILGTPAYMSPEQVRGDAVDARTDIFSLGAVLYEMISGRRAFAGESVVESGHAILHDEPPPLENVSPLLAQLLRRSLAKEPEARIQSARDLAFALEMLRGDAEPRRAPRQTGLPGLARRSWWALVLLGLAGLAIAATRLLSSPAPTPPISERVTFRLTNWVRDARFTPDGRVVFTARDGRAEELFERNLAGGSIRPLGLREMSLAAISPSGELAVLFPPPSPFGSGGTAASSTLARVPAGGGTPRAIEENVVAADWSPSGELAIVRSVEGVHSVEFPIGRTLFKTTGTGWIKELRVSPRGNLLAFVHHSQPGPLSGEVVILDPNGKKLRESRHWRRVWGLAWSPRGEVWFAAGENVATQIHAMPVTGPDRTIYTGAPLVIVHDVAADGSALIGHGFVEQDVLFVGEGAPTPRDLSWNDRSNTPIVSADGRVVLFSAFSTMRGESVALLRRTSGDPPQILGRGYGLDLSPEGRWALIATENGLTVLPTGAGTPRNVPLQGLDMRWAKFSAGTNRVVFVARPTGGHGFRLFSIDLDHPDAAPLSDRELDPNFLELSPDKRWAGVVDSEHRPVLHPLTGGKPVTLTEPEPGATPAGWASNEELWLARVEESDQAVIRLARFDVKRRVKVEERTVYSGRSGSVDSIHVTADGKNIVFGQARAPGHLYVIRGLEGAR